MTESDAFEARYVEDKIPTDCCNYGVISLLKGVEICRVWERDFAEKIAKLLNDDEKESSAKPDKNLVDIIASAIPTVHINDEESRTYLAESIAQKIAFHTNEDSKNDMERQGFDYAIPKGSTLKEWRENVKKTSLHQQGDTVLVWVNEADLNPTRVIEEEPASMDKEDQSGVDSISIDTRECGYCEGSGRQPSEKMIEEIQRALDRGILDSDDLIKLTKRVRNISD